MKQVHIKLPESLHRKLKIQAAIRGQTLQDYVVEAVKDRIALDQSNTQLIFAQESTNGDGTK